MSFNLKTVRKRFKFVKKDNLLFALLIALCSSIFSSVFSLSIFIIKKLAPSGQLFFQFEKSQFKVQFNLFFRSENNLIEKLSTNTN